MIRQVGARHRTGAALQQVARVGVAIVAIAGCGATQSWTARQQPGATGSTIPALVGTPTTAVGQIATDSSTFCDRLRQFAAVVSAVRSPTAAEVLADARTTALLARDAPSAVKQAFEIEAETFAAYAAAVRRAGPDPRAQAGAVVAVALSLDGRRITAASAEVSQYMSNTCHVQLDPKPGAGVAKLEAFDVDDTIRKDPRFWTLPVSTSITVVMGSTTVDISATTLDAANSLEICQDVASLVYAKAPNAVIEVGPDFQHTLARSTRPGGCSPNPNP